MRERKGDDKSKQLDVASAIDGKPVHGVAVSSGSGQVALDALVPIRTSRGIVGTLKIGARMTDAMVTEIKNKTGAEVAMLYKGKTLISTLGKDASIDVPDEMRGRVLRSELEIGQKMVSGADYLVDLRHVASLDKSEGIVIASLVANAGYARKSDAFVHTMLFYCLIALPFVMVIGLLAGIFFARPLVSTAAALTSLGKGDEASLERYSRRGDEIGDMARAFGTLREEVAKAFRLGQTMTGMPTGVMTLDRQQGWAINFANPALVSRLETEAEHLPFAPASMIGEPSVRLLEICGLMQADLDKLPAEGARRRVSLGRSAFTLTLANIHARHGEKIGVMIAWEDISERGRLADQFEQAVKGVAQAVEKASADLRKRAEQVRGAANETQVQAEAVARAAEESSASVTSVASAADELLASIEEIRRQISNSSAIAGQASTETQRVVATVLELQAAAKRIGTVVEMIGTIASQTNLLALNATIESARAGEAGRGFAVVASEVKALAGQTARAAEEVVAQISAIQGKTDEAVSAISSISEVIAQISDLSTGIAIAVDQQRGATSEIAQNTQQTASGTHEVAASITHVSGAIREAEEASDAMLIGAGQLSDSITTLNAEVESFLARLAA